MATHRQGAKTQYTRRAFLATSALAATGVACGRFWPEANNKSSLIQIFHAPKCFTRRAGDFTANVCGAFTTEVKRARYRLNHGPWLELRQAGPRVPPPLFTIEMSAAELLPAINHLEIEAKAGGNRPEVMRLEFEYDPNPVTLPVRTDWSQNDFDVHDGHWEHFWTDDSWRVRPVPGSENYDRIIVVSGAFAEGRRIETDLIYRYNVDEDRPFGFGLLPFWGGRPDDPGVSPRRGWNFSLAWFYSHYNGAGLEFSYKHGGFPPSWISSYRDLTLQENSRYFLTVECWPEVDAVGRHRCYRQRMKWWPEKGAEPKGWIELADIEGAPLPPREYGVALIAHRCQVEFGPVHVTPIASS